MTRRGGLAHASKSVASMGCEGVEFSSRVLSVVSPPDPAPMTATRVGTLMFDWVGGMILGQYLGEW